MKKKLTCLCLALACVLTSASAAFSDISDSALAAKASILDALGIMQGMGDGRFDPDGQLTRAQFCKIAVTAMGVTDVSEYANYSIFSDVSRTHWAANYINAAMRHPELRACGLIRGYADGTFGPNKALNYGELCTMLLRMLGYTDADVGMFWPADYMKKAQELGITEGVSIPDAKAAVTRADAASLLLSALSTPRKGDGEQLIGRLTSDASSDCILLATSETNASLAANEALFYEYGAVVTRETATTLDRSLIGARGILMLDGEQVLGLLPSGEETETLFVIGASEEGVLTTAGLLKTASDVPLYIGRKGYAAPYGDMRQSLRMGDTLTVYPADNGGHLLLAVIDGTAASTETSFVYEDTGIVFPAEYTIVKNGVTISSEALEPFDVITVDASRMQAQVSEARVSGVYTACEGEADSPTAVTVCGVRYAVSEYAARSFAEIRKKDYITLLFDAAGEVVAARPKNEVEADMRGVVTGAQDGAVTVDLFNGLTLADIPVRAEDLSGLVGSVVSVGQSYNGAIFLTRSALDGKVQGDWTVDSGFLGSAPVSPSVQVYAQAEDGVLTRLSLDSLRARTISEADICHTVTDGAGTVITVIIKSSETETK